MYKTVECSPPGAAPAFRMPAARSHSWSMVVMIKQHLKQNVYEAFLERLKFIFEEFDNIYISFSGGKDSGLLIGLSAKVEIILSQVTDVYAVPYDAVGTDENGGSVVYARSGGETEFTAIPVETGMETDYYIEISGEGLSDGMEVKTSANDTATAAAGADDAQQSGENAMFSMDMGGGMPGGDMPGGGGGGGMPSGGPGGM